MDGDKRQQHREGERILVRNGREKVTDLEEATWKIEEAQNSEQVAASRLLLF